MRPPFDLDPELVRQIRLLAQLDFTHRVAGADLRNEAMRIATNPDLRDWLRQSDELVERLKGSVRLRKRRRRGILRNTIEPDLGLPSFMPPLDVNRTKDSPDPVIVPLLDELEWAVVSARLQNGIHVPTKPELTFDDARAFAGLRASVLYDLTQQRLVPGQIFRQRGDDGDSNIRELRFRSGEFAAWAESAATEVRK
jgi:hypothetical protein